MARQFALLLPPLLCLAVTLHAQPAQPFDTLVDKAKFIFIGDVVRLGASTMPSVPPTANTAVVRVRKVLTGTELLEGFAGREITVTLQQPSRVERAAFFTNVTVYGDSLAAEEVAPNVANAAESLGAEIAAAKRRNADRAFEARLAEADLVFHGRVLEVRKLSLRPLTEHDPMWAIAVVQVEKLVKGNAAGIVEVRFASSNDEMWRKSPKYVVGDTALFILKQEKQGWTAR